MILVMMRLMMMMLVMIRLMNIKSICLTPQHPGGASQSHLPPASAPEREVPIKIQETKTEVLVKTTRPRNGTSNLSQGNLQS